MKVINFFSSKVNWTAIVLILVSFQSQFEGLDLSKMTIQSWISFALGLIIIVFRTFANSGTVGTPKEVKAFKESGTLPERVVSKNS